MDFKNLIADVDRIVPVHFTAGRTSKIDKVVLHHNAGNLTVEQCYASWLARPASAHYQVEANGRIGQLVHDKDTAWHAGDANPSSIGIEHANNASGDNAGNGWTISDVTLDQGAKLVAAICHFYGLGRPEWGRNVFGHRDFMSTACPGEISMRQRDEYMKRAGAYYDEGFGGTPAPAPVQASSKPSLPYNFPLPYPLPAGHFFGDVKGPAASHGGFYDYEKPWVKAIQQSFIILGLVPGVSNPHSPWADGIWEQPTTDAAVAFQRKYRPNGTTLWGQIWDDDLATLRAQFA